LAVADSLQYARSLVAFLLDAELAAGAREHQHDLGVVLGADPRELREGAPAEAGLDRGEQARLPAGIFPVEDDGAALRVERALV
jgi:hypothetical protein